MLAEMPSFVTDDGGQTMSTSPTSLQRPSIDKQGLQSTNAGPDLANGHPLGSSNGPRTGSRGLSTDSYAGGSTTSVPNGRPSATSSTYSRDMMVSRTGSAASSLAGTLENGRRSPGPSSGLSRSAPTDHGLLSQQLNGRPPSPGMPRRADTDTSTHSASKARGTSGLADGVGAVRPMTPGDGGHLQPHAAPAPHRFSSPPSLSAAGQGAGASSTSANPPFAAPQLRARHTLQVPKLSTSRNSRDFSGAPSYASAAGASFASAAGTSYNSDDVSTATGRFSPTARRTSMTLARRGTRSLHSDMHLDEIPQDEDAARWSEAIRQKRASKRKRKEDEDDERVVVGTKVDQNHVNWVTAYNMLTGIRFTVSRTNAKMDRALTPADFDAKHKFSFDITGNELTPSAKYDFKFKDYAPWVFRHLRARFRLDPADYLMSLTSKYILSELGSPGKSGSFFYFSRDYKYIIKTIHHTEHKLLRRILRDYYEHVESNPNTLLSQFYGLHRVKIAYGRKIHFVVMNNLFPPHRDIHRTFDLKGSTIGRDFREEELERNPRATLKDLNWLRRDMHLELGPSKKSLFVEQMVRDVRLLQRLKIMDYSMLVGTHDLGRGNEENLRDKTLQIFEPGGERTDEPASSVLTRTPSKLENMRKARELRQIIKKEKPIPLDQSSSKMPDEMLEERRHHAFYGDDGGFRATHEDGRPGEEIYYLGIIDCLTHYGLVKKAEHLWKGMSSPKSQISPIPPEGYGERFIRFISGITKPQEEAERARLRLSASEVETPTAETKRLSGHLSRSSTDRVVEKAERQARRTDGESEKVERTLAAVRSPSAERSNGMAGATLPVVEEAGEAGSTSGRSRDESDAREERGPEARDEPGHGWGEDGTRDGGCTPVSSKEKDSDGRLEKPESTEKTEKTETTEQPEKQEKYTDRLSGPPDDLSFRLRGSFHLTGPAT
ncbi:MAG: Phosphatidylinositol-4-phosphate 5-kinase [Thelocarpon impressellum]|nr:MAG: Phosphatidylinositol-4-phosphate 5-kinase [Thelocarpon impressellum]